MPGAPVNWEQRDVPPRAGSQPLCPWAATQESLLSVGRSLEREGAVRGRPQGYGWASVSGNLSFPSTETRVGNKRACHFCGLQLRAQTSLWDSSPCR